MQGEDDRSGLERARERLYEVGGEQIGVPHSLGNSPAHSVPHAWADAHEHPKIFGRRIPFSYVFLGGALLFFLLAGGAAAWLLLSGGRAVSPDNITISVQGPTTIAGGDTVSLVLTIKNQNPVALTFSNLTLDFPEGTRSGEDVTKPLVRYVEALGEIPAGGSVSRTIQVVLFGEAEQGIHVPITLEYRTENSNAIFEKSSGYDLSVTTTPLTLTVDALKELPSGQSITVSATVHSNASSPIANILLVPNYPFGFTPQSSSVPSSGGAFTIGTLAPGAEKTIRVTGVLTGQDGDERVFRFTAGVGEGESRTITVAYSTKDASVVIARPFLTVSLSIDGDTSDHPVIRTGVPVRATLTWSNTLPSELLDGSIEVALKGDALDTGSITPERGFYRSSDTTVIFNRETDPALRAIEPGDNGIVSFTFSARSDAAASTLRNPSIILSVSVSGRRVGEDNVPINISSTISRTVRVATNLTVSSYAARTLGPFTNTGPWPPKANEESTYTIFYSVSGGANAVADAVVTAELPSYMRFMGSVNPADGSLTYSEATRTIRFTLGELSAGAVRQVAFQVALLPSESQRSTSPVLLYPQRLSGFDRFAQQTVGNTAPALTTALPKDPSYTVDKSNVQ